MAHFSAGALACSRIGGLDPAFSVTPDWDYYLRLLAAGERIGCLPRIQYKYTVHADMGA